MWCLSAGNGRWRGESGEQLGGTGIGGAICCIYWEDGWDEKNRRGGSVVETGRRDSEGDD